MNTIIDRLQYFMVEKGINNNQMTVIASLSVGLIGRAIKHNSGLNSDSIEKILYAFPELNPDWLLTGRGGMLIKSNYPDKNTPLNTLPNTLLSTNNEIVDSDCANKNGNLKNTPNGKLSSKTDKIEDSLPLLSTIDLVPFYNLPVTAGALGVLESSHHHSTSPDGYVRLETFNGCEKILPVVGVSMEPIIRSGDYIGIKSIDCVCRSWDFIQTGVIYLIVTREDRMIKYIEKADDEEFIICSSPNYHTFKVHKSDILEIHRVKAVSRGL